MSNSNSVEDKNILDSVQQKNKNELINSNTLTTSGSNLNSISSKYPTNVLCDFRKLKKDSLIKILSYYHIPIHQHENEIPNNIELACMVAKLFEARKIAEVDVINHFSNKYCLSTMDGNNRKHGFLPYDNTTHNFNSQSNSKNVSIPNKNNRNIKTNFERLQLDCEIAKIGEQVAVKVSNDGDGEWILGNVMAYDEANQIYDIQDEDETTRMLTVSAITHVKRLYESASYLHKGDDVYAVFPDTTSFYRGTVVRNPRPPTDSKNTSGSGSSSHSNTNWDVVVRFDDDEDESGRSPPRRIPSRFVLLVSDVGLMNNLQSSTNASNYVPKERKTIEEFLPSDTEATIEC